MKKSVFELRARLLPKASHLLKFGPDVEEGLKFHLEQHKKVSDFFFVGGQL